MHARNERAHGAAPLLGKIGDIKGKLKKMIQDTRMEQKIEKKFDLSKQASRGPELDEDVARGKRNKNERKKRARRLQMLGDIPTFKKFTAKQLDLILDHAKQMKVEPGGAIISQGEIGEESYLIEHGEAIVSRKVNVHNTKEEAKELVRLKAPVTVGERAIETSEVGM